MAEPGGSEEVEAEDLAVAMAARVEVLVLLRRDQPGVKAVVVPVAANDTHPMMPGSSKAAECSSRPV